MKCFSRLRRLDAMKPGLLIALVGCSLACGTPSSDLSQGPLPPASDDRHSPSSSPPGGLEPSQTPMFVSFGWDDNGYADGMAWALDLVRDRHNPTGSAAGSANARTLDGGAMHMSFYFTSAYATEPDVAESWRRAFRQGHEVGIHTRTHTTNVTTTLDEWRAEIAACADFLEQEIGVHRSEIMGFRTPYLEHNEATFIAIREFGLVYDCSLEEGFDASSDGTDFLWPYTLDTGSPGNEMLAAQDLKSAIGHHPGLWEMPAYTFVVPPDAECEKYGVPSGLRDRLAKIQKYFQPQNGKITGFDYNLWYLFHLSKEEVVAILKYTLDQRLAGNRSPLLIGMHSEEYSEESEPALGSTYLERRQAIEAFVDYAASLPEVRIASSREILDWIREPSGLENSSNPSNP